MAYRRVPVHRRPYHPSYKQPYAGAYPYPGGDYSIPEEERIPLPTEEEPIPLPGDERAIERKKKPFGFLPFKLGIEELLLIGLIIILFREGIDDDILILLLLYILFAGFESVS